MTHEAENPNIGKILDKEHLLPLRIYYEDTDAAGFVYHANYLKFAERGRTEFLSAIGFDHQSLGKEVNLVFAVRSLAIDFVKPSFLDDRLLVRSRCVRLGGSSLDFRQSLYRGEELVARLLVQIVALDKNTGKPLPIRGPLRERFALYCHDPDAPEAPKIGPR